MSEPTEILEAYATGEEISPVIAKLEETLIGVPRVHALIALTTLLLLLQHPHLTPDQVYEGVNDVSRYVCTWVTIMDGPHEPIDKSKLN